MSEDFSQPFIPNLTPILQELAEEEKLDDISSGREKSINHNEISQDLKQNFVVIMILYFNIEKPKNEVGNHGSRICNRIKVKQKSSHETRCQKSCDDQGEHIVKK